MNGRIRAVRYDITAIVGRLHVGTPDAVVTAEFERRLNQPGRDWTARERRRIIQLGLAEHHRNARLYADIMGGRI